MDIKLKNIKYSTGLKAGAVIIVWLCAIAVFASGIFLLYNQETLTSKSYYDTDKFNMEFARHVENTIQLNVKLKSEDAIKTSLSQAVNFLYLVRNTQTGESVTNVTEQDAISFIKSQPYFRFYDQWQPDSYWLYDDPRQMLAGTPYEVYAAVMEPLQKGDIFYEDFQSYTRVKQVIPYAIALLAVSAILMIGAFVYLVVVTGKREKDSEIILSPIDSIYTDVHTLLVFIAAVISIAFVENLPFHAIMISLVLASIVFSIDIFIGLSYLLSMARQIKKRQMLKNSLLFKLYNAIIALARLCLSGKMFKAWILLMLLGYGGVNGILFAIALHSSSPEFLISLFLLICFNAAAIYFAAKSLLSLSQIMNAVKEISTGNLEYALDSSNMSIAFFGFAEDIQSIQHGLKKAVDEAVKGERMKTDLITNVSHDLKTPLTSIINYVDLLKREDLNNEKANGYVSILEEKSARLKQLVEDLIEASKASSGSLPVKAEKVDLNELIMQACGEYEEKFKNAGLDIRINASDKNIFIWADGKHMWRIIENLLSNVVKYSMPNSRVYIDIAKENSYGLLTIKNISAFPLNISPEQLTERFVRGDVSRTTEGAGLGLSIAMSLTNLQQGRFNIAIDGDLFKVTAGIPLI